MLEQGKNTGVIIDVKKTDWIAGGETGIKYRELVPDGDWEKFASTHERQRVEGGGYDTNSCVTFSAHNVLEMVMNRMYQAGEIPEDLMTDVQTLGYHTDDGFNFSDWFTAVASGTTVNGNSLPTVWNAIRNMGTVPQREGYDITDFHTIDEWLDPTRITTRHLELGAWLKNNFLIQWEWALLDEQGAWDKIAHHLKHSPLHIATPTCKGWNSPEGEVVPNCGDAKRLNHATAYIGQKKGEHHKILDHYVPFVKLLDWDYYIPYAIKVDVTVRPQGEPLEDVTLPTKLTEYISYGDDNESVRTWQKVLHGLYSNTTGKPYMRPGLFGPYGPQTKEATHLFQIEHGIVDPEPGKNVGPQTFAVANRLLDIINS